MFGTKLSKVDRLILMRSDMYTHSEFEFSGRYKNVSFSATCADGSKCARFKHINYSHAIERWDTVIVNFTDQEEDRAMAVAKMMEGMPYDLMGQICHVSKFQIWKPSPDKTWCSKTVAKLCCAGRGEFRNVVSKLVNIKEIRPDELHMLATYFFGILDGVRNYES